MKNIFALITLFAVLLVCTCTVYAQENEYDPTAKKEATTAVVEAEENEANIENPSEENASFHQIIKHNFIKINLILFFSNNFISLQVEI